MEMYSNNPDEDITDLEETMKKAMAAIRTSLALYLSDNKESLVFVKIIEAYMLLGGDLEELKGWLHLGEAEMKSLDFFEIRE